MPDGPIVAAPSLPAPPFPPELLDQTERALKAQLDEVAKTRKQVASLMQELDAQLTGEAKQPAPAKPPTKPKPTGTTRRRTVNR